MTCRTYAETVELLKKADVPVRELRGHGCTAVMPPAGRVIGMAFTPGGTNLVWTHSQLSDADTVRTEPVKLVGGFGGDRLWFAPELDYHWRGRPDWDNFSNYQVAAEADPGPYLFTDTEPDAVSLRADIQLPNLATGEWVGFQVQRAIRMTPPPVPLDDPFMKDIDYVGIETSHALKFDAATKVGRVDLWHLLQVPVGSLLIVPLNATASADQKSPLSYGMPGEWVHRVDRVEWRYTGIARAKFGLSAHALTGRAAVLHEIQEEYWCLMVREFSVDRVHTYADHPYVVARSDQAFQAWDGFGFGEMEYHSPMLDAQYGPREIKESDRLWAFGGSHSAITDLAKRLLGVDTLAIPQPEAPANCDPNY